MKTTKEMSTVRPEVKVANTAPALVQSPIIENPTVIAEKKAASED